MNRIILFISLITICLSQTTTNSTLPPLSDSEYQQQFTDFLVKYNKSYTNVEFTQRFLIFKDNLNYIRNFNSLTGNDTDALKLGINQFADITLEEFHNIYLNKINGINQTTTSSTTSTSPMISTSSTTGSGSGGLLTGLLGGTTGGLLGNLLGTTVNVLTGIGSKDENENINTVQSRKLHEVSSASDVDWRYLVPTVKNQGQCGSGYAFSATGAIEAVVRQSKDIIVLLSEQQIIDCSKTLGNNGCNGGNLQSTFTYIMSNGGINLASVYPYQGIDNGTCRFLNNAQKETILTYSLVQQNDQALEQALSYFGPISVGINGGTRSFMLYKSGIYDTTDCVNYKRDHAVLVVGMGENSIPYYNVKNSWGTGWGEEGYIRIVRGKNMCGIVNEAMYPVL